MTRLLFWQDQSSNVFCWFAFAKRRELLFQMQGEKKKTLLCRPALLAPRRPASLSYQPLMHSKSTQRRVMRYEAVMRSVYQCRLWQRAGPQFVRRSQRCLNFGPRTDMIFEKRLGFLAFRVVPEVTTEVLDSHCCTHHSFTPPSLLSENKYYSYCMTVKFGYLLCLCASILL